MIKLYELTERYRAIANLLDSEDAELLNIQGTLENVQDDFEEKAVNVAKMVMELKADAETYSNEIIRLAARKQTTTNKIDWLKSYLLTEMTTIKLDKIKGDVVSISVRDNPPSVAEVDIDLLPGAFIRTVPEKKEPDKKAIIDHFKNTGEILDGVDIVTDKKRIEIR